MRAFLVMMVLALGLAAPAGAVTCPAGSTFELRPPGNVEPVGCIVDDNPDSGSGRIIIDSTTINGVTNTWPGAACTNGQVWEHDGSGGITCETLPGGAAHTINKSTGTPGAPLTSFTDRTNLVISTDVAEVIDVPGQNATLLGRPTLSCPTLFTKISSNSFVQGCMLTGEASLGAAVWEAAAEFCFTEFGAELPTTWQYQISFALFSLTDETDDAEWAAEGCGADSSPNNHMLTGPTADRSDCSTDGSSRAFRCWLSPGTMRAK